MTNEASMTHDARAVEQAADFILARTVDAPRIAIILGSGLGPIADAFDVATRLPYAQIPGFPESTVAGHSGTLIAGSIAGVPALAMQGRFHLYEGHDADTVALPARVAVRLGARTLFITNAAGGVNRTFQPGELMLIDDHINLMGSNPLTGPVLEGEARFPDMSEPYDRRLLEIAEQVALRERIRVQRGVYCALLGPSYETPSEVRMLERLGADAVGMSTVPEVIVARASGARVLAVSIITNAAAGGAGPVSHDDVLEAGRRATGDLTRLLTGVARRIAAD
jgi:purine-nucleoside phosphorylase